MEYKWRNMLKTLFVVSSLSTLLLGCGTTAPSSLGIEQNGTAENAMDAKKALAAQRAKEFWAARIAGDTQKAYSYLSPGSKVWLSLEGFQGRSRVVTYRQYDLESTECDSDMCKTVGILMYDHHKFTGAGTYMRDQWVWDGGQLWYVFPK